MSHLLYAKDYFAVADIKTTQEPYDFRNFKLTGFEESRLSVNSHLWSSWEVLCFAVY